MSNQEFTLPSGAKLNVTVAPFAQAHGLLKTLLMSAKGVDIGDTANLMEKDISVLKDAILNAAVSEEVEEALFKCFERVSYNGDKLTRGLLDDPKVSDQLREDYYTICLKVIEVNCKPFFKRTFSGLKTPVKTVPATPAS